MCLSRLDTEEEGRAFIKDSLARAEALVEDEGQVAQHHDDDLDPISDNEEDDLVVTQTYSCWT